MIGEGQFALWVQWAVGTAIVVAGFALGVIGRLLRSERRMTLIEGRQEAAKEMAAQREESLAAWVKDLKNRVEAIDGKLDNLISRN